MPSLSRVRYLAASSPTELWQAGCWCCRSEKSQRDQRAAEEASKPHAAEKGPMQMTSTPMPLACACRWLLVLPCSGVLSSS